MADSAPAYNLVGQRVAKIDGRDKATGLARYADDIYLPGMLFGKLLRSPIPHGRILHIDPSAALKLPGVKAVVTGSDFPDITFGFTKPTRDRRALPRDRVRYIGEGVAGVAAVDRETAEEAARLIKVDYDPLPAVFDPLKAMEPGAPQLHDHVQRNISCEVHMDFGNVEQAFRTADYVRKDTFHTQAIIHGFLEPFAVVADYEVVNNRVRFWGSKQSPYIIYRNLARGLGIPPSRLHLIQPHVGGGFGGKHEPFDLDFAAIMLSKKAGRPVKITYEQEEVFLAGYRRHPMIITLEVAAKRDGTLLGYRCNLIADGGAYAGVGHLSIYLAGAFLNLPFRVPNFKYDALRVYTNKPFSGALRGHGIPQARFAAETQLDLMAADLGIDPLDLRLKNAVRPGDVTANDFRIASCGFTETLLKAAEAINWRQERGLRPRHGNKVRGLGMACGSTCSGSRLGGHDASTALVRVHEEGTVTLLHGSPDVGQGSHTVLAQILAEELGLAIEDVQIAQQDSDVTILDPGTYGSRVTCITGNAVLAAAADVRRQLFEAVAERLEVAPEDLEARDRRITVKGAPWKGVSFVEAVRLCFYGKLAPIIGRGHAAPGEKAHFGNPENLIKGGGNLSSSYTFTTQAAEVEVDLETGEIEVIRFYAYHDCGYPINPTLVEGQLEGACVGGLGQALFEDLYQEDGLLMNPSFMDYGFPTALDAPAHISSNHIITNDPLGPYGAKESGEGTQISTMPAIVNAIYDATGIMVKELPLTKERMRQALQAKRERKEGKDAHP